MAPLHETGPRPVLSYTGLMRNIPGRVVDETIEGHCKRHGHPQAPWTSTDMQHMDDRTVYDAMYYDASNDVTDVHSDTTVVMMSALRGR